MNHRPSLFLAALTFLSAALLSSCGMKKAVPDARAAVAVFHTQFNDGKYKEIYDASHADMKKASPEADFIKFLETIKTKLGKQTATSEQSWNVGNFNFTTSVVLVTNTEFEHGKGVEKFTYVVTKNGAKLKGYYIDSKDMMMK